MRNLSPEQVPCWWPDPRLRLQNWENTFVSHPACGTSFLQPQQTKTLPYKAVMRVEGASICKVLRQHLTCYRGSKSF